MYLQPVQGLLAVLLLATAAVGAPASHGGVQERQSCPSLLQRRAWHTLTDDQRREYIRAELCLMKKQGKTGLPATRTLFDDLLAVHQTQAGNVHNDGWFLPFHRLLVHAHETLLLRECEYSGGQPYWDEAHEAGRFTRSPVFRGDDTGFGGDGVFPGSVTDPLQRCVRDGLFASYTLHNGPGYSNRPHCINRAINDQASMWSSQGEIDNCLEKPNFREAWPCIEANPHRGGHAGVGGEMDNAISSPGDPLFYLHHTFLDRNRTTPKNQTSSAPPTQKPHPPKMKKLFRGSKGRTQPEDEDQNRDALFGNRTAAPPPPPGDGYGSNSNPYAPERGGGGGGYGAPQGGYGRSNNEIGNRGGYGGASNPYALHNGGDNGGHNSSGEPDRAQLFGARQQKHDYSYTAHANEPSARDDDEDTELVKQEIKDTNRKTAGLTESALAAARRAEASGIATIERLGMQGERLSNTEKNLDVASVQNRIAEDKARELKQYNRSMFVPAMGNPLRSSARAKEEEARILAHHQNDRDERERTREFGYEGRNTVGRALNDATRRVESKATTGLAERSRYQFEADESDDEKEKVIANNLDELGAITGRLKGLAMATSKEVDRQNVQIERIMKKSDRVDDQIAINHNRIRKIH